MLNNSLHPNTTVMLQAWQRIMSAPHDIDGGPSADDYPGLLGRLFIVEALRPDFAPFRIAGDDLTNVLGRNLVGTDFLNLWVGPDRQLVAALLNCVTQEDKPGLLRGFGETSRGRRIEVEIAIAPLRGRRAGGNRLLCLYQTLGGEAMLKDRSVWSHRVRNLVAPEPSRSGAQLRLVSNNQ